MVAVTNAQSLADFQTQAAETLDRINRTGEAEMLTVNGEVRAFIVSPAAYQAYRDSLEFTDEDLAAVRTSVRQLRAGQGRDAQEYLRELDKRIEAGEFGPLDEVVE